MKRSVPNDLELQSETLPTLARDQLAHVHGGGLFDWVGEWWHWQNPATEKGSQLRFGKPS
jgi:hypothetical protein